MVYVDPWFVARRWDFHLLLLVLVLEKMWCQIRRHGAKSEDMVPNQKMWCQIRRHGAKSDVVPNQKTWCQIRRHGAKSEDVVPNQSKRAQAALTHEQLLIAILTIFTEKSQDEVRKKEDTAFGNTIILDKGSNRVHITS